MKIAGLTGQYIQVSRNQGKITYGGDQGFFAGASFGSPDERKQKLGCGITLQAKNLQELLPNN